MLDRTPLAKNLVPILLKRFGLCVLTLIALAAIGTAGPQSQTTARGKSLFEVSVNESTAVRFFYDEDNEYFHFPLIFRAVSATDPRLNTAPMGFEGRTAYILTTEMQQLLQELGASNLPWQGSKDVEALGSFKKIRNSTDTMEIMVVSSKGTARAKIDPKTICESLEPLDPALKTPRALWEFQIFRIEYDCQVPGFVPDAYPDHF
jgi:hypothetical protein